MGLLIERITADDEIKQVRLRELRTELNELRPQNRIYHRLRRLWLALLGELIMAQIRRGDESRIVRLKKICRELDADDCCEFFLERMVPPSATGRKS